MRNRKARALVVAPTVGLFTAGILAAPASPASAMEQGTSDTVIVCEPAVEFDAEDYTGPGFVCEITPEAVLVDGVEELAVAYELQFKLGGKVKRETRFDYEIEPAPQYLAGSWQWGRTYQIDYVAILDTGRKVLVSEDDWELQVPMAPGKKLKPTASKFRQLKKGTGTGYRITWNNVIRADGYQAQVKRNGKWKPISITGKTAAEFGKASKAKPGTIKFRVRAWNAGGHAGWQSTWNR